MNVSEAVNTYQKEITKWHEENPSSVANYEKWLAEYKE